MDKDIITLDTAILAHEKGFKFNRSGNDISYTRDFEPNDFRYLYNRLSKKYLLVSDYYAETNQNIQQYIHSKDHPVYDAPLQYELQKWLRVKHKIDISVTIYGAASYGVTLHQNRDEIKCKILIKPTYENIITGVYEEALEIVLKEALKLIKL